MVRVAVLLLLVPVFAEPPAVVEASSELERTEAVIAQLRELKAKVASTQTQIDELLRVLSEQKGALQNPKTYNAFEHIQVDDSPADSKPAATVRCAALTSKGARCTRPAVSGGRYCSQHKIAHAK